MNRRRSRSAARWDKTYQQEAIARREGAARLLATEDFVTVSEPEDPDWPDDGGDLIVYFTDPTASHEFSDLVDGTVDLLAARPDVRDVRREDREMICVWGEIDGDALAADLNSWWRAQLATIFEHGG